MPERIPIRRRDDQLAAHVRVEHLANFAPDLVEVGPVVIWDQPPEDAPEGCGIERQQEGDDEHQHELQQRGQCGQADVDRVAELTQQVLPQVRADRIGRALDVDR